MFSLYLGLGFDHIADLSSYDHILFVVTLCAVYLRSQWRQVLVLITAFTIGHSLTLLLATLQIVRLPTMLIEVLIPITILITAATNILSRKESISSSYHKVKYATALFFGLIHGLGFSNYLRSLLGNAGDLLMPLLAFNVGLEIGQILIVTITIASAFVVVERLKAPQREWNLTVSGAGLGVAIVLIIDRLLV